MTPQIIHREGFAITEELCKGMKKPDNGDCVVMSAEINPKDERGGDIVRVKGMKVQAGIPLLAQHMHRSPDGSPTVLGKVDRSIKTEIEYKGKKVAAMIAAFTWADTELANKYKQLWPEFLNKVSIGAHVIESEPLDKNNPYGGQDYKETEVFELSVVTIPANPAAGVMRTIQNALGEHLEQGPDLRLAELSELLVTKFQELHDRFDRFEEDYVAKSEGIARPTGDRNELDPQKLKAVIDSLRRLAL